MSTTQKLKGLAVVAFSLATSACATGMIRQNSVQSVSDNGLVTQTTTITKGKQSVTRREVVGYNQARADQYMREVIARTKHEENMARLKASSSVLAQSFQAAETPDERARITRRIMTLLSAKNKDIQKAMSDSLTEHGLSEKDIQDAMVVKNCMPKMSSGNRIQFTCS